MTTLGFDELANRILSLPCPHRVRLVGVDGFAGSGKTTFAARLAANLGAAPIVPMDDFASLDDLTEYWPRFEAQILEPLSLGGDVRYQMRDWAGDYHGRSLGAWREIPFAETFVFEGIGAARRELSSRLTFAVWVAADAELRLQRGVERDQRIPGALEIWQGFMPGEQRYFEADGTFERAGLVVDGRVPYDDRGRFRVLELRGALGSER